jgi:hypothetical protein
MARTVHEAMSEFLAEVREAQEQREADALYRAELEPRLRQMGVRTDRNVEGPRR